MNQEFDSIIKDIINNYEFKKIKKIKHHGVNRYNHSLRVARNTYKITKFLNLNYIDATKGAMLHDFFTNEVKEESGYKRLIKHPEVALNNAKKHFEINELQEDIIKSHMFPVTIKPPKYKESWIVDIVDDISSIYERLIPVKLRLRKQYTFLLVILINLVKIKY